MEGRCDSSCLEENLLPSPLVGEGEGEGDRAIDLNSVFE
jgi:hypothetical protein